MHTNVDSEKRLLILDDEQDVATTICMMASFVGFQTRHTADADTFLTEMISWAPTHVAVDLQLAELDGIEVIHQLAKMGSQVIVIIISGLGGRILDSAARVARESGLRFAGVLAKPFTKNALQHLLQTQVRGENLNPSRNNAAPLSLDKLKDALQNNAFMAFFQPKICCITAQLVGFECLARWPQPDGSMIPPDQFIALAEQNDLIDALTRQVYLYALSHLPIQARDTALKFALNLSPINLNDEDFPRWLLEQCRSHNIAPAQLILELTETASMQNPLSLLQSLTQFRIRGFQLSIDDFGVGYSSLVQLSRLPFSELKIDQMFVKHLQHSEESQKIVTAVVGLGKSLGLNVVAEGVEDAWALNFLKDIGCDEAQGFFIAKPMDHLHAKEWKEQIRNKGI